jgi:hypothetical protein
MLGVAAGAPVVPAAPEPSPTRQIAPAGPHYPVTARTGIEGIDQVLTAVAPGDQPSLRSLVEFTNAKCTKQDGLGGSPKCREGEADETAVEVLSFLSSPENLNSMLARQAPTVILAPKS